ncbi:hypothetical protein BU108_06300 [Staphylococcus xylosus]|uniref:NUMOD4 motif-containing HNH endonuclease n=1 Tax=Staphylococcus xylosus TaxID=1288 RepID=UPI000D1D4ECD|nr:NUMOD4 motif-containing HNH endonuclease [Staphylococcus xylosus]PTH92302.1 hypothetical protein BU108_06300 [Staphylococcus xylosus]
MREIWVDVIDYEGLYKVSNSGKVWSVRNKLMLKQCYRKGYLLVTLNKNGNAKSCSVHRLVAMHFIPLVKDKECVNHIDENKTNNNVENLEWCNHKENNHHGTRSLRVSYKMKNSLEVKKGREIASKKLSIAIIGINIKDDSKLKFKSMIEAKKHGFSCGCISNCVNKKQRRHKGYEWFKQSEFKEDDQ